MFYVNDEEEGKCLYSETIRLYCVLGTMKLSSCNNLTLTLGNKFRVVFVLLVAFTTLARLHLWKIMKLNEPRRQNFERRIFLAVGEACGAII